MKGGSIMSLVKNNKNNKNNKNKRSLVSNENKIYKVIQEGVKENLKYDVLTDKDVMGMKNIVNKFIKEKELIVVSDEALKFYRGEEFKKIELRDLDKIRNLPITVLVYSPNAITDAKILGELLGGKGYQHISVNEIAEYKTYVLNVEFKTVVKFSYIQGKFFKNIPIIVGRNGVKYITPEYLLVDIYYKYFTPRINVNKWNVNIYYEEALFSRELFRTDKVKSKLKPLFKGLVGDGSGIHENLMKNVVGYCNGRSDIILTGLLVYNRLMAEIGKVLGGGEDVEGVANVSYVSVLCIDVEKSLEDVRKVLGKELGKNVGKELVKIIGIKVEETQPLLIYFDKGYKVMYKGELLVELIGLPTCYSFNLVDGYQMSNFHQVIWFLMLQKFLTYDRNVINNYRLLINRLIKGRIEYLKREGLTGLEKGILQIFQGDCVGANINYKFLYHLDFWEGVRRYSYRLN